MNNMALCARFKKRYIRYDEWAFTLTLKNEGFCDRYTHVEQYDRVVPLLLQLFDDFQNRLGSVVMSIELTKVGNLHFHMYIRTPFKYAISTMRVLLDHIFKDNGPFGFYYLKPIDDSNGWNRYINKNPYFVERYRITY